jgi:hypothetical protein
LYSFEVLGVGDAFFVAFGATDCVGVAVLLTATSTESTGAGDSSVATWPTWRVEASEFVVVPLTSWLFGVVFGLNQAYPATPVVAVIRKIAIAIKKRGWFR